MPENQQLKNIFYQARFSETSGHVLFLHFLNDISALPSQPVFHLCVSTVLCFDCCTLFGS